MCMLGHVFNVYGMEIWYSFTIWLWILLTWPMSVRWGDNFRSTACPCTRILGRTCTGMWDWCQHNINIHWFFQVFFCISLIFVDKEMQKLKMKVQFFLFCSVFMVKLVYVLLLLFSFETWCIVSGKVSSPILHLYGTKRISLSEGSCLDVVTVMVVSNYLSWVYKC